MSERTAILERRSVVLPSATESEDRTELNEIEPFAEQVEMELGYAGLKNRILAVKETMPDHLSDSAFVDTLSELEMNPFSPESVAEYKKIALADVRKNSAKFSERNARIFGCIARGIIYVMVASVASVLAGPLLGLFWGVAVEMLAVNIFVAMVSIMFFMLLAFSLTNNIEWQKTEIYRYQDEIPEFVLRKALQIKQRVPSVEFFIEHIGVRHDPFLIVRYKTQEYYVEVWAEPKFESEFFK